MTSKHKWRTANLLRKEDMPLFHEAAKNATKMSHKEWIFWLNKVKGYKYAFLCKMAKQVGLCTPGHAFYPKMQQAGLSLIHQQPKNAEADDDLLWKQD